MAVLPVSHAAAVAGVIDGVAAYVDNSAITLRELDEQHGKTVKAGIEIARLDVLNTMINRTLLLNEAYKLRIKGADEAAVIEEYIDIKIRSYIRIGDYDIREFYDNNIERFTGLSFKQARDSIEKYLMEKEVNDGLRNHINALRSSADIRILIKE